MVGRVAEAVEARVVVAGDGLPPREDAVRGRVLRGGDEAVALRGAIALPRGDRVGTAEHLLGEVGVAAKALLVGAVLAEDFDVPHVVRCDDDVAVWMGGPREICW